MSRVSITTGASGGNKRRAAQHYGRRTFDTEHLAKLHKKHGQEVIKVTFRYDTLPTGGEDELILRIPQYAVVTEARLQVTDAFAGGTSLAVGSITPDAVTEDPDAFITDAEAPLANLDAVGKIVVGASGVGLDTPLNEEIQVKVNATGAFTAGEATLEIVYIPLEDRADQFNDDL